MKNSDVKFIELPEDLEPINMEFIRGGSGSGCNHCSGSSCNAQDVQTRPIKKGLSVC